MFNENRRAPLGTFVLGFAPDHEVEPSTNNNAFSNHSRFWRVQSFAMWCASCLNEKTKHARRANILSLTKSKAAFLLCLDPQ